MYVVLAIKHSNGREKWERTDSLEHAQSLTKRWVSLGWDAAIYVVEAQVPLA